MGKNSKTHQASSPGRTPGVGRKRQPQPQVVGITPKQPAPGDLIPDIQINAGEQDISIQYAPSPITKQAVEQILQWIADQTGVKSLHAVPESKAHILIVLKNIHYTQEQPKEKSFSGDTLVKAYKHVQQQLAMTNIDSLQFLLMKEAPPVLPLIDLDRALKEVGAYGKIKSEKNRQVLEAYLTTEATQGDLKQMAGVKEDNSVNNIIHRNLRKVFEYLPPEVQQEYGGSANEAIKRKASTQLQTRLSKERIKKGVAGKERIYTNPRGRPKGIVEKNPRQYKEKTGRPKGRIDSQPRKTRELSGTHKQSQSRSLTRYHQEQEVQQRTPTSEEHTIVDLSKPSQDH